MAGWVGPQVGYHDIITYLLSQLPWVPPLAQALSMPWELES